MLLMWAKPVARCIAVASFAATTWAAPVLTLSVQPSYKSPADVWVDVYLVNPQSACQPMVLDATLTPIGANSRPNSVLEFEIIETATGKRIERSRDVLDLPGPAPSDFLYLDCGRLYGGRFSLADSGWRFPLGAGRYTIRAKLKSNARAYLETNPHFASQVAKHFGIPSARFARLLPPAEQWCSAESTFTIESP